MCGKTRQDRIRNTTSVATIVKKMVETWLRWFGHVERRLVYSIVQVDQMKGCQITRGK
jgi:hypothetical protein